MKLVMFLLGTFAATAFASNGNSEMDAATQRLIACANSSVNSGNNGATLALDCKDAWLQALVSEAGGTPKNEAKTYYGSGGGS